MVGKNISVFWEDDDEWYPGTISEYADGRHKLDYEDGEVEHVDLSQQKFKVLNDTVAPQAPQNGARKRKNVVSDSDSDAEAELQEDDSKQAAKASKDSSGKHNITGPTKQLHVF